MNEDKCLPDLVIHTWSNEGFWFSIYEAQVPNPEPKETYRRFAFEGPFSTMKSLTDAITREIVMIDYE